MLDTRREVRRILGKLQFSSGRALLKFSSVLAVAAVLALFPEYEGMSQAARWAFFIMLFAAGLWVTEAIPGFAVGLLVIALEIYILGKPGGVFATSATDWEMFVQPWSSPLIWLFFCGFVLAAAATKTRLDRWFAVKVLGWFGEKPGGILMGLMMITFLFSMFMSNTATTAMMMAVLTPILVTMKWDNPFSKAVLLGIPFAANIGGMGTIIGSPPNAIAAGSLGIETINFTKWMLIGIPPAVLLAGLIYVYLRLAYPSNTARVDLSVLKQQSDSNEDLPNWKIMLVLIVFIGTVLLWMTGPLHKIPTPVVSFIPITIFAVARVIDSTDIRTLNWDVLLLLTGGLSLGVAVSRTGLADWLVASLPVQDASYIVMAFAFSYFTMALSNFMSHTAATNILVPIAMAVGAGFEAQVILPIALGASSAMCLPISTPPNAIAYAKGHLKTWDFIKGGLLVGLIAPAICVSWALFILSRF